MRAFGPTDSGSTAIGSEHLADRMREHLARPARGALPSGASIWPDRMRAFGPTDSGSTAIGSEHLARPDESIWPDRLGEHCHRWRAFGPAATVLP